MDRQKTFYSTYLQLRFSILVVIIVSLISLFSLIPSSFSAEVMLEWDPNTESDLAGYKMYYKTGSSGTPYNGTGIDQGDSGINIPLENLATPDNPSFSLTGLQDNEFYYLVLTAVDSSGNESGYSNEIVYETSSTTVTYVITSSNGPNGSITPAGTTTVTQGANQTYSISPDANYYIKDVQVDGASVDAVTSHTFSNIAADHTISAFFDLENQAPIADAGPDQNIESAVVVSLKGSNSIDLDDGIASFLWEQVSGPFVELLFDPVEPDATFVSPDVGPNGESLIFRLTATDYSGDSSSNECIVNVIRDNMAPTADAGEDQNVGSGNIVTLDASNSSDLDGGIGTYQWSQISGNPVILSNSNSAHAEFVAPIVNPEGSSLKFSLTIADTGNLQARDACIVNVVSQNTPPISDAGPDETVTEGSTVTLDGAGSSDSDDGIVLYLWKQISGTPVTLSDSTAMQPTFTALSATEESTVLELLLTVKDEGGLQSSDICLVSVTPVIQTAPVKIHSGDLDGKKPRPAAADGMLSSPSQPRMKASR